MKKRKAVLYMAPITREQALENALASSRIEGYEVTIEEGDLFLLCSLEDTRESCSQGLEYIEAAVIEDYVAGICLVDGVVYGYVLLKLAEVSGEPIQILFREADLILAQAPQMGLELVG